ncbi:TPA: DNA primase, partial [Campylobacter coli]|nr:DNA primase [Campylobacter coli]
KSYEDSDIREFESKNFSKDLSQIEFLWGICKVNLAFLNHINITNSYLALKKQIFTLIEKNFVLLSKNLNDHELVEFLKENLFLLKNEKDEEKLEALFKNLHKFFSTKNLNIKNLKSNCENNNDEEPF